MEYLKRITNPYIQDIRITNANERRRRHTNCKFVWTEKQNGRSKMRMDEEFFTSNQKNPQMGVVR